ncbi:hypothetical protein WP7W18E02_11120 [Aeromonas media]|nr:hypothetical protein WP7W18E02_11120 [Aeromonas media]
MWQERPNAADDCVIPPVWSSDNKKIKEGH